MAQRGAQPRVHPLRRRVLRAAGVLFTPLLPDDYLELINPLWSTRELRGRVERVVPETRHAATVVIRPGARWDGHRPGQYVRVGVVIDGVHHWRAYSLTSEPGRPDGCISITPKRVERGTVSGHLVDRLKPGAIVRLGGVEGTFVLPEPVPRRLLFISAGSGVTPIMSMLADLSRRDELGDAIHVHCARTPDDVIFGARLRALETRHAGLRLRERITGEAGRLRPEDLDGLCPDWREREAFLSGPGPMLDAMTSHWQREGDPARMHLERFQPVIGGDAGDGEGGTVTFARSGRSAPCDGGTPILVAGEAAGLQLPYGCRMGICHTCVGTLRAGRLRDLRTGEVHGTDGEVVRTCIHAPEGPVTIEL